MNKTGGSYQHALYGRTHKYLVVIKHHQWRACRYELTGRVVQEVMREAIALTSNFRAPFFPSEVDLRHVIVCDKIAGESE